MATEANIHNSSDSDWVDCTASGQSYGKAAYRISKNTIYIMANKTSLAELSTWNTIGNIPQNLIKLANVGSSSYIYGVAWTSTTRILYRVGANGEVQTTGNDTEAPFMFSLPI